MTATDPRLAGYRLVHRAIVTDLRRLTGLADDIAGGRAVEPARWAAALAYLDDVCRETQAHLAAEEALVWPVVRLSCGQCVDLAPMHDDHRVLDRLLGRVRAAARSAGTAAGTGEPGRAAVATLASALLELSAEVEEHLDDEEREVLPMVTRFVSDDEYQLLEGRLRRSVSVRRQVFFVPWVATAVPDSTTAEVVRAAGWRTRLLLGVTRRRHLRRRRAVFG